ncbi:hypothetical protein OG216_44040 [Streptomycetaceae bacterium NBC_01309]
MGFSGGLVVVRCDGDALELEALQQDEPEWPEEPSPPSATWYVAGQGWQVVNLWSELPDEPEEFLQALALETGSPTMLAVILDSDTAYVTAFGTSSGVSEGWIEARSAAGYASRGAPLPGGPTAGAGERVWFEWIDGRLPDHADELAAWAEAAGLRGDREQILSVMRGDEGRVEDRFLRLLMALGVPPRS